MLVLIILAFFFSYFWMVRKLELKEKLAIDAEKKLSEHNEEKSA